MRAFTSEDGRTWIARLHDGNMQRGAALGIGWEVVQFDPEEIGTVQRITYRPAGWLSDATIQDLIAALREGEAVRASWTANCANR